MTASKDFRKELRQAGYSERAIKAVWPSWWSEDAEDSISATTELRYTVARRLGLLPRTLFDGPPDFVWHEAKFKNLGTETERDRIILSSFGTAVGRHAIDAANSYSELQIANPQSLREAILSSSDFVDLGSLLSLCWGVGIPVMYLTVFPLGKKRMHAMTVQSNERYAILLGHESRFPSQVAYWVAHEMGHVALGHVSATTALLEFDDPLQATDRDEEEYEADRFALALLTGDEAPTIVPELEEFNARELAHAAIAASHDLQIDPGVIALVLGHTTERWKQVFGALKIIFPDTMGLTETINKIARAQLDLNELASGNRDYLLTILGQEE